MSLRYIAVIGLLAYSGGAIAEFEPEAVGLSESLPAQYPEHWVMIHDFSFFHMLEGKVIVTDPLATDVGGQYKGTITASFTAAYTRSSARNEHYVAETFYSRGGRGGERTDVVSIYDPATLEVAAEIMIPPKRITGMPKDTMVGLLGADRFLGVYNFTPSQSVSIVDLEKRKFVAEVPTPGCGFLVPNGQRSFTSICSNGSMLTSHLDEHGELQGTSKTDVLFDAQDDPIFEGPAITGGVAYFPTFTGQILPINVSGESVAVEDSWSLTAGDEKNWRPGGIRPAIADSEGAGYFLMHPHGAEGTHKDGGSEVWVYDLAKGERTGRIVLTNWGITLGSSGTADNRLLFVTNTDMGVDVYKLPSGDFVHTLGIGAATPFMMRGAE